MNEVSGCTIVWVEISSPEFCQVWSPLTLCPPQKVKRIHFMTCIVFRIFMSPFKWKLPRPHLLPRITSYPMLCLCPTDREHAFQKDTEFLLLLFLEWLFCFVFPASLGLLFITNKRKHFLSKSGQSLPVTTSAMQSFWCQFLSNLIPEGFVPLISSISENHPGTPPHILLWNPHR